MMHCSGLTKLMEECGELIQAAAKTSAFPGVEIHPDGSVLRDRLTEEMADVMAAICFTAEKLDLDIGFMDKRSDDKIKQYHQWDAEQ